MAKTKIRTFRIDGDAVSVELWFDEGSGAWLGEYPDFDTDPRWTPNGRPWKCVYATDCPYADPRWRDCGTCGHLKKEHPKDLVGVCFHEDLRSL